CTAVLLLFFFSSRRRHTRFSRDWSSDVCSSDLRAGRCAHDHLALMAEGVHPAPLRRRHPAGGLVLVQRADESHPARVGAPALARSEERRVGKECRSRWSPDDEKEKSTTHVTLV